MAIVDVAPGQSLENRLATSALTMTLDPSAEWRQMFDEVWRTYRDYFYDDDLHGLDWNGLRAQYGGLIDQAVTRWDVNFLIGELIGEINASHTYVGGGDTERRAGAASACSASTGLWRTAPTASPAIVRGAPWDIEDRSPLDEPGVDVNAPLRRPPRGNSCTRRPPATGSFPCNSGGSAFGPALAP